MNTRSLLAGVLCVAGILSVNVAAVWAADKLDAASTPAGADIRNVTGTDGECAIRYGGVTAKLAVPRGESRVFNGVRA